MVPSSPTVCYGALDPPVGGTFHFENLIMPPLTKTCPKMVLSDKGGSLCVVPGERYLGREPDGSMSRDICDPRTKLPSPLIAWTRGSPETARKVDERAPEIEKHAKTIVDD